MIPRALALVLTVWLWTLYALFVGALAGGVFLGLSGG